MQMIGTCFLIAFYLKLYGLEETLIVAALGIAVCIMFADCKK